MGQRLLTDRDLGAYLIESGLVAPGTHLETSRAGDGNINWVRRVRALGSVESWVVKQARPALEAFPEYEVSTERLVFEARFFEVAAAFDPEGLCPRILHFDEEQRVLVLEDLGHAERFDAALARDADVTHHAEAIAGFLGRLHAGSRDASLGARFRNDAMRRLHGDHIFFLPYRENDFPLSHHMTRVAAALRADASLVSTLDAAYTRYLDAAVALVHADVQPTNILLVSGAGTKLLDAEIAHLGDPAFDVGVFLAHLIGAAIARGERDAARPVASAVWTAYTGAHGPDAPPLDAVARYAGVELLRRTLGAARMPGVDRDEVAAAVVESGRRLVENPGDEITRYVG